MKKTAVIFWSGTGNTESMANAVLEGMKQAGADVTAFAVDSAPADLSGYDALAFGCPAMGAEVLEEEVFAPAFDGWKPQLAGKPIALFGSYGWGDGEWMRDWEARMMAAGAEVVGGEGVICHETPDEEGLEACRELGEKLANA